MIAKSHIFSEMVNSVGGIVYFASRYAQITGRARAHPVDINSNRLELVRSQLSAAVRGWKDLSDAQAQSWIDYAEQTPWKNALGDTVFLTGQAMYIATRCVTKTIFPTINEADYRTAPPVPGLMAQPTLAFQCCDFPDSGIRVLVTNNDTSTMSFHIMPSPTKGANKRYYRGPYRFDNSETLLDVTAEEQRLSGCFPCVEGARLFFVVRGYLAVLPYVLATPVYGTAFCCIAEVEEKLLDTSKGKKAKTKVVIDKETIETAVETS